MKLNWFLIGVAAGLAAYLLLRPRYYPSFTVEEEFEIPYDPRLGSLLADLEKHLARPASDNI